MTRTVTRTVELRDARGLEITSRSGHLLIVTEAGRVDVAVDGLVDAKPCDANQRGGKRQVWRENQRLHIRSRNGSQALTVRCPPGTDVVAGSDSGQVELRGDFGDVRLRSASSQIKVDRARSAEVRTKNGRIRVAGVHGQVSAASASGAIDVERAHTARAMSISGRIKLQQIVGTAHALSVSGSVEVDTDGAGDINVGTVSGSVKVRVPTDRAPRVRAKRKSGHLNVRCPQGDDLTINVASVSGAITVDQLH